MNTLSKSTRGRQAFTLVELLVVVAIIATLAMLGVAGFKFTMSRAGTAKTIENMRQLAAATIAYTTDNNGFIPIGDEGADGGRGLIWINKIAPNLGFPELGDQPLNKTRDGLDQWQYLLTKYKDAPFICGGFNGAELEKSKKATGDAIGGIGYNEHPWQPSNGNANAFWNIGTGPYKAPPQLTAITFESSRCMYASSYDWHLYDSSRAYDRFGKNNAAMVFWDGSCRMVNKLQFNRAIDRPDKH